ncbi:class I SAM-dependent methyltransferase [Hoeflea sp. AS16]|uniref:class I SAM-dependent methyltransferase n=1 Tax=Hoeflea sp. AS16 TaxID=3135779 RepID=UPI00316D0BC7
MPVPASTAPDFFAASRGHVLDPADIHAFLSHFVNPEQIRGKSVLDVGCRLGEFVVGLSEMGATAFGIDISAQCIDEAKVLHPEMADRFGVADVKDLSHLDAGSFDFIICSGVLCYLKPDEWGEALKQMGRLLSENGRLLVLFQKPRPAAVRAVVAVANIIPAWLYINVVAPVAAAVFAPSARWLLGSDLTAEAFRYRVLLSLRGLQFGYPDVIADQSVPVPTSRYASAETSVAFLLNRNAITSAFGDLPA